MKISLENLLADIGALSVVKKISYISTRTKEGKGGRREIRAKNKTKQNNKKHTQKEQVKNS